MRRIEQQEQITFVAWFVRQYPHFSELINLASFGENVGMRRMRVLKQMGLTAGYPDLFIAIPKPEKKLYGLYIEMKTKTGRLTLEQKRMHEKLKAQNYQVIVARSCIEAISAVSNYLV